MKVCVGCDKTKKPSEYYASKSSADGLNRYCKWCCKVNRALEAVRKRDKKNGLSYRQEYRARQLGIPMEEGILLVNVFKRAHGICAVCDQWVAPRYASMDHRVPISKGGHHTYLNIDLTHIKCNLRKGDRT